MDSQDLRYYEHWDHRILKWASCCLKMANWYKAGKYINNCKIKNAWLVWIHCQLQGLMLDGYVRGVKEGSGKAWWGRFLLWCSDLSHKWFMHDRMLWLQGEQRKVIGPVNNGSNTSKWWGCAPLTRTEKLQERRGGVWDGLAVRCDWTCSATDLLASQAHKHTVCVQWKQRRSWDFFCLRQGDWMLHVTQWFNRNICSLFFRPVPKAVDEWLHH